MSSSEIIIVPVGSESFILLIRLLLIVVIADILTYVSFPCAWNKHLSLYTVH